MYVDFPVTVGGKRKPTDGMGGDGNLTYTHLSPVSEGVRLAHASAR